MHSLPVRQQDNPEVSAFLFNFRPAADAPIGLDVLTLRGCDDPQNPFVLDYRTVGTRANCFKILCNFHGASFLPAPTGRAARASPVRCKASVATDRALRTQLETV
jgi:hypothetical protein